MGGMGQGPRDVVWCLSYPFCHPEPSRALHIAFSKGTSETTSFLLPLLVPCSPQIIFLCFSGTRGLGSLRAVPTSKLLPEEAGVQWEASV